MVDSAHRTRANLSIGYHDNSIAPHSVSTMKNFTTALLVSSIAVALNAQGQNAAD
jgi:hypothetical protein